MPCTLIVATLFAQKSHARPVWSWHHERCCTSRLLYYCRLPPVQLTVVSLAPAHPVTTEPRQLLLISLPKHTCTLFDCRREVHRWRDPSSPRHLQPVAQWLTSGRCGTAPQRWGPPGAGAVTCSSVNTLTSCRSQMLYVAMMWRQVLGFLCYRQSGQGSDTGVRVRPAARCRHENQSLEG